MARKSQKISGSPQRKGFGVPVQSSTAPISQLRRAEALVQQEKWSAASTLLTALHQAHPQDPEVLVMLVNACLEMGDMVGYGRACSKLVQISPKNADAAYVLVGAYIANGHLALALAALRRATEKFPDHEKATNASPTIADLEVGVNEVLTEMGLAGEEGMKVALLHEQGQVYLAQGDLAEAQQAAEEVLQLRPDLVSVRNNLSLIHWQQGNLDSAIAAAQQVLDQEPDNIHALSNLIHFHCLKGELDQMALLGDRLKTSQGKAWDGWTKKAEGLSYLRNDAGVLDVFEQAQAAGEADVESASLLFLHLVAVAMARSGRSLEARKIWQKLLQRSPNYDLARDNLQDINQPAARRHGAWPFLMSNWLDANLVSDLQHLFHSTNRTKDESQIIQAISDYLAEHPSIIKLLPIVLERGDPAAQGLMLHLATWLKTPEMLAALKTFALGQWGTDEMRHRAALKVVEAGLLPREQVRLWIKGAWREIQLLAYEFHDEPSVMHTAPVEKLLRQTITLLNKNSSPTAKQAEALLEQALQAEPDAPDLRNNLALAYMQQGRKEEAITLLQQVADQHSDYVFAKVSLARLHLARNEVAVAEALLQPLLSRQRFSFTEFGEFSDGYLFLLMAQEHLDGAEAWLRMWESVDPNHPKLRHWQTMMGDRAGK
jgi:tetratricopeptide (TPR) repeat protein